MGMATMQIYWLVTAYKDEKQKFYNDVNSLLSTVINQVHLQKLLTYSTPEIKEMLQQAQVTGRNKIEPGHDTKSVKQGMVVITVNDTLSNDSNSSLLNDRLSLIKKSIEAISSDSSLMQTIQKEEIQTYANAYRTELQKNKIDIPFEMAIIDSNRKISYCTCDTNVFKHFAYRTSMDDSKILNFRKQVMVAAFPKAMAYIIKQIAALLIGSIILLVTGCISFSYLISLFFRHQKLAEIREQFINNMTHELKTPVSSVGVALELLLDERNDYTENKKKQILHIAQKELIRLNTLIETTLKIAAAGRRNNEPDMELLEVTPLLDEIKMSFLPLAEKNNAIINIFTAANVRFIKTDKIYFTSILQNLIENALKYNTKPAPHVTIKVEERKKTAIITVEDNGIGIEPKYLDKIFDKFFRVPSGDIHDKKGSGLGLNYVKTLVEQLGGTIDVKSILKEGTIFTIHLPSENQ